jgi:hypothetical protein
MRRFPRSRGHSAVLAAALGAWAPNRPAGFTTIPTGGDYGFDAASYPVTNDSGAGFDGVSNWAVNFNPTGGLVRTLDATALKSPSNCMRMQYQNAGSEDGAGSLGIDLGPYDTKRFYCCFAEKFTNASWDPISNKGVVLFNNQGAGGNYNFESQWGGLWFKLLDGPGGVGSDGQSGGSTTDPGNAWHMVEWLLDSITKTSACWIDDSLLWTYNPANMYGNHDSFLISGTWHTGASHATAFSRDLDHITLAYKAS